MSKLSDLLDEKFKIGDSEYGNSYEEDIKIDPSNVNNEIIEHLAKFTYYSQLHHRAQHKADLSKIQLDELEADLDTKYRLEFQAANMKYTETLIKNEITKDMKYKLAIRDYNDAKHLADRLKSLSTGMLHRKDLILAVARNEIATGFSDPSTMGNMLKKDLAEVSEKKEMLDKVADGLGIQKSYQTGGFTMEPGVVGKKKPKSRVKGE